MLSILCWKMLFPYLFFISIIVVSKKSALQPIRHHHVDILTEHTYKISHITSKIGLGFNSPDLRSCVDACFNHDFCRTATYDSQLLVCSLFEECSTRGQILPDPQTTVISFLICDGEPTNMAFVQPLKEPITVQTAMANLKWVKNLETPSTRVFFVNDQIYAPYQKVINVYETNTYTLVQTIQLPVSSNVYFIRGDSQGILIYFQSGNSSLYTYSSKENIITSTSSAWTNFVFCYSETFIVVTAWPWNVADVYLRSILNHSATFIYRIDNWNQLIHCVIVNDQQLIGTTLSGGMQTTILSKTNYSSTIMTIPLNTTYLPTGSPIHMDAAGRIYTAPTSSKNASAVFLPDGKLVGVHGGTLECAGKTSKYKFIFMSTAGQTVSIFEYVP